MEDHIGKLQRAVALLVSCPRRWAGCPAICALGVGIIVAMSSGAAWLQAAGLPSDGAANASAFASEYYPSMVRPSDAPYTAPTPTDWTQATRTIRTAYRDESRGTTRVTDPFVVPSDAVEHGPFSGVSTASHSFSEPWGTDGLFQPVSQTSWTRPPLPQSLPTLCPPCPDAWCLQILPDGLIYRSYLAGMKEPGIRGMWVEDSDWGAIWDISLGGRAGILRYGTTDSIRPEGWQFDIEGAALLRLDMMHERELMATDFRFGTPLTWGNRQWQWKLAYYHLSSHLGDEYKLRFPSETRVNYVRDSIVLGLSWTPTNYLRFYGEAGWSFFTGEHTEPWEFQVGAEYSHLCPDPWYGSPFFAINGHLRQELDFGGGLTVQTGWQWRGYSGHLFRVGLQFYCGQSDQYEFWNRYERKIGAGLWYNF